MRSNTIVSIACRQELINEHEMFCECTALHFMGKFKSCTWLEPKWPVKSFFTKKRLNTYLCTCIMKSYESCFWVTKILSHSTKIISVCEQVFSQTALGWLLLLKYCC